MVGMEKRPNNDTSTHTEEGEGCEDIVIVEPRGEIRYLNIIPRLWVNVN